MTDKDQAIMVRVDLETRQRFDALKEKFKHRRATKSEIFSSLVEWVSRLDDSVQEEVLFEEEGFGLVGSLIDITAGWQEADHAFQLKRWVRAVDAHESLFEKAENVPKMKNFLDYRLGFIWIDIAYERRHKAFEQRFSEDGAANSDNFELTAACLERSIEHSTKASRKEPMALVALFNMACAHSLRAQYEIEWWLCSQPGVSDLTPSPSLIRGLESEFRGRDRPDGPTASAAIESYAALRAAEPASRTCDLVEKHLRLSLEALHKVYESCEPGTSPDIKQDDEASVAWVIHSIRNDEDLAFLRSKPGKSSYFEQCRDLVNKMESRGDTVAQWCQRKLGAGAHVARTFA